MSSILLGALALKPFTPSRRQFVTGAGAALGAEAGWLSAVGAAAAAGVTLDDLGLPPSTTSDIAAGRIVAVQNWMPESELSVLRADARAAFAAGHYKADALATYGQKNKAGSAGGFDAGSDRMVMPSFYPSKGTDGPWVDASIGNAAARRAFKSRMASVKAALGTALERPSLAADGAQTHEMSYTRYGPGAFLARHTDEHHGMLKIGAKPRPTRRSVSWLVYLNEDWDARSDGGCLRVHERAAPAAAAVGARGADLQIGWLKATSTRGEEPVFLDARAAPGGADDPTCVLYTTADGARRDLSAKPFAAKPALYISGGDFAARRLLVDDAADAARFHLVDAPKSPLWSGGGYGPAGEDGGERIRDIPPEGGTLVLFDSVSLPHEVMPTVGRERFALSGWFHEAVLS